MKIGMVGLGKLGMPCAVAMTLQGHDVMGYDIDSGLMNKQPRGYLETGPEGLGFFNKWLGESTIRFGSLAEVAAHSEIIFVAVQTPHHPRYEGITRLPDDRMDFDYSFLKQSLADLSAVIEKDTVVVIVSTVLPGTFRRDLQPIIVGNPWVKLCYNPFFIAMGTSMHDFLNPEFVLFGVWDEVAAARAEAFYKTVAPRAPIIKTTVENAELIKVIYNTYISSKIAIANTFMEICHKIPGCDADVVTDALALGTERIISPAYLRGGMGDGGGCHPRDNIAMSWLARKLNLSYDWFEATMMARERQTEWLADLMCKYDLPKCILGYAFKTGTNITTGSPALLLSNLLSERGVEHRCYDPYIDTMLGDPHAVPFLVPIIGGGLVDYTQSMNNSNGLPHVYLIGAMHPVFQQYTFPPGSVVIDPWRYLNVVQDNITYIGVGAAGREDSVIYEERFWTEEAEKHQKPAKGGMFPEGFNVHEVLAEELKDFEQVVEVGCGEGRLAQAFPHYRYMGLDVNQRVIELAAETNPGYRFEPWDYDAKVYPSADVLLLYTVLLHVPDSMIQKMINTLCMGGVHDQPAVLVCEILGHEWRRPGDPPVYNREEQEYIGLFGQVGYRLVRHTRHLYKRYESFVGRNRDISFILFQKE